MAVHAENILLAAEAVAKLEGKKARGDFLKRGFWVYPGTQGGFLIGCFGQKTLQLWRVPTLDNCMLLLHFFLFLIEKPCMSRMHLFYRHR